MSTGGGGGLDRVVVVNVIRAWTPRPRRPRRGLPLYVVVSVSCVVVVKLVFCCLFFFLIGKKGSCIPGCLAGAAAAGCFLSLFIFICFNF